jgi:hypothetical protein
MARTGLSLFLVEMNHSWTFGQAAKTTCVEDFEKPDGSLTVA